MMARASATKREISTLSDFEKKVQEYMFIRAQDSDLATRKKRLRDDIMEELQALGEPAPTGGQFLNVSPDTGTALVERQRRVSRGAADLGAAREILEAKGIADEAFISVPVLDESFIMSKVFEGVITEDELDMIYPVKETFALIVD